jgi:hypothetical protein
MPRQGSELKLHWCRENHSGLLACGRYALYCRALFGLSYIVLKAKVTCKQCLKLLEEDHLANTVQARPEPGGLTPPRNLFKTKA